jgi:CxxC motif-containing protein (DUF1111 family)
MTGRLVGLPLALALLFAAGCGGSGGGGPPTTAPALKLGDPIPGLSQSELASFERGRLLFTKRFTPSEGLGPMYNATSCSSCHSTPLPGGSSKLYRNFFIVRYGDPLTPGQQFDLPGFPSPVIPAFGPPGDHANATFSFEKGRPVIPHGGYDDGNTVHPIQIGQRNGLSVFGVGMFEAVSDQTIMQMSDPNDDDMDGISGRYNTDADGIGRFGVKAQASSIANFTRPPLMNQMGITTDPLPSNFSSLAQVSGGGSNGFEDGDGVSDPELSVADTVDLVNFTTLLAPPTPKPFDAEALQGEQLFEQFGCAKCHVPELPTSRGPIRPYTDLLIHYMGDALADYLAFGTPQATTMGDDTTAREFRTAPLWGVSMHAPFLHDGRAETLREAIEMHGGEATAARDEFENASDPDKAALIAFLEAL